MRCGVCAGGLCGLIQVSGRRTLDSVGGLGGCNMWPSVRVMRPLRVCGHGSVLGTLLLLRRVLVGPWRRQGVARGARGARSCHGCLRVLGRASARSPAFSMALMPRVRVVSADLSLTPSAPLAFLNSCRHR